MISGAVREVHGMNVFLSSSGGVAGTFLYFSAHTGGNEPFMFSGVSKLCDRNLDFQAV